MGQYKHFFIVSAIAILFTAGANAATAPVTGLATPNYVDGAFDNLNSKVVHNTGNETIAGTKTFSTQPVSTTTTTYANAANNALVTKGQVASAISGKVAANAAITGATHTKITYDSKGLVTGGTNLAVADLPDGALVNGTNTTVVRDTTSKAYKVNVATANGATPGVVKQGTNTTITSGAVNVANGTTSAKGVVQLTDTVAPADSTKAVTGKAVAGAISDNIVHEVADLTTGATGNIKSTTLTPSMAVADKIAANAVAGLVMDMNYTDSRQDGMVKTVSQEDGLVVVEHSLVEKSDLSDDVKTPLDNSLQKATPDTTFTSGHIVKANADGKFVDGGALGSLATKNAVGAGEITDGSVGTAELAANAVTSAKIADGTIADADLASNSVTTAKIANTNVTKEKLATVVQNSLGKADTALQSVSGGAAVAGKVATAVVESGTAVAVTMDYVKIPVGSPTAPTSVAQIWVQ